MIAPIFTNVLLLSPYLLMSELKAYKIAKIVGLLASQYYYRNGAYATHH